MSKPAIVLMEITADPFTGSIKCIDCGRRTRLQRLMVMTSIGNEQLCYFQVCDMCQARFACNAMGTITSLPADKHTRWMRSRAHEAFDRIWREAVGLEEVQLHIDTIQRNRKRSIGRYLSAYRRRAYGWLTEQLGWDHQIHIGKLTADQCHNVITVCEDVHIGDIIRWAQKKNGTRKT